MDGRWIRDEMVGEYGSKNGFQTPKKCVTYELIPFGPITIELKPPNTKFRVSGFERPSPTALNPSATGPGLNFCSDALNNWLREILSYGVFWDPSGTGIHPSPTAPKNPLLRFSLLAILIDP